jgi:hypothetical protein
MIEKLFHATFPLKAVGKDEHLSRILGNYMTSFTA